jgi:hypothetical protein
VLVQVDPEEQQAAVDRLRRLRGEPLLGQQQGPGPEVGPAAHRDALQRGDRRGGPQLGPEPVEQHREAAGGRVGEQRLHGLGAAAGHLVADAAPAGDRQLAQPGAGTGQQVARLGGDGAGGPGPAGAAERAVHPGEQGVVGGAQESGPRAGQHGEVLVGHRACDDLADRVGELIAERRGGEGRGQGLEGGGPPLVDAGEAVDEGVVHGVDQGEGLGEAGRAGAQQLTQHQRTAPAAGNHCSSGSGSVLGGSSR